VTDRRKTRRRRLPFVRSAILDVGDRSHIVVVTDLSPEGAFLCTRLPIDAKQDATLRFVVPRDGKIVALPCHVMRQSDKLNPAEGRPTGLAVRFKGLDAASVRRIEEFAMEGFLPSVEPTPQDHFEYRSLERFTLDVEELNSLGLDGWQLVSALPSAKGFQLVLVRRL
jgi:hypothetical protein